MKNGGNLAKGYFFLGAIFCLFFLPLFFVFPLGAGPEIPGYIHEVWQIEDGLPQNYTAGILQTRDGYIWIGTQEGIARFDGVKFVTFNADNTPEIKFNNALALLEDREGSLWIGTYGGGLLRFKAGKFTGFNSKTGAPGDIVFSLCEGRDGSIWIGTHGEGVVRLHEGKFTTLNPDKILSNYDVLSLYENPSGILWIGTSGGGLIRCREGIFTTCGKNRGLSNSTVLSICEDREGNLWIGTGGGGLIRLKNGEFKAFTVKEGLANNYVCSIYEDKSGGLWIGTWGGLNRIKDGKLIDYMTEAGRFSNAVVSIAEDREENLWLGTGGEGLVQLKPGKFKTYTTREGLPGNIVLPIFGDGKGTLWLGIWGQGLIRWKNGTYKTYTLKDGLSSEFIKTLYEDRRGNLWIGTQGGGLNRFKDNRFTVYTTKNGLSGNYINAIYGSRDGCLWIGTNGQGLDRFADGGFRNYTTTHGLPNNVVKSIYEDSKGNLWIATAFGGLVRFRDGIFETYNTKEVLSDHCILTIYEDKEENLWLGTFGGGLIRFKDGKFKACTTKEGLFNNHIFHILEDEKENLWMSCNRGIFRVSKQEFGNFAEGKSDSLQCISYGKADGMKNIECSGGCQPAGWKSRDGKLWFPTVKGLLMIEPGKIKTDTTIPPVIIEKIKIDDHVMKPLQHIEIPPGKRRFEFQYTSPSFIAPKKIKFKYKLEGFDEGWIDGTSPMERVACYTNIPPGRYCFRVIACNNNGIWNETGAFFYFTLNPFFYQTIWFYAICTLCVLALGLGIHWLRVKQILIKERKKYEKVRLSPESAERYIKKLLQFMEREKPYLDPDISLHGLSKRIRIPDHYLSQVINGKLNRNFYDFINQYRIEEARRLLADSRNHLTIIEVAFEVGFNSKSTFNRAFKKYYKTTPSDFKKAQKGSREVKKEKSPPVNINPSLASR